MTDEIEDMWTEEELPKILKGECWPKPTKQQIDVAFSATYLAEEQRGAFYLGVESCNCEGLIPNIYSASPEKTLAFNAGYKTGCDLWP